MNIDPAQVEVGPRTIRLSGELADRTLLTSGTSPEMVRQARALLDEARSAAGVAGPHTITVYLIAITGPDGAVTRTFAPVMPAVLLRPAWLTICPPCASI